MPLYRDGGGGADERDCCQIEPGLFVSQTCCSQTLKKAIAGGRNKILEGRGGRGAEKENEEEEEENEEEKEKGNEESSSFASDKIVSLFG